MVLVSRWGWSIALSALLLAPGPALSNPPCGAVATTDIVLDGDLDCSQDGVAIRLDGTPGLVIDGTAQHYRLIVSGNDAINGNGDFITIKNVEVTGTIALIGNDNTLIGVKAQNLGAGMYLTGSRITVDHCDFDGSATGMYLTYGTGATVTNNIMTNASTRGLYLHRMISTIDAPVTVDSSNVFTGSHVGIVVLECTGLTLSNLILDNPVGITGGGNTALTLTNLDVSGAGGIGIELGERVAINGITAVGRDYGLFMDGSSGDPNGAVSVENAIIRGNWTGIRASGSGITIHNSTICGNEIGLVNSGYAGVFDIDATNNFWGSPSGPRSADNSTGTGDVVNGLVTAVPFLSSGAGGCPTATATPTPTPTPTPTSTPTPTPTPPPLDHFTCYKASATKGSVRFPGILNPPGISLVDQFVSSHVAVKKPKFLCAPTDKNGEDPTAPMHSEHLKLYPIKNRLRPVLPTNIKVVDQFNPTGLFVNAKKAAHILVPSVKSLTGPTPIPMPGAFVTDHFQCYKITASKHAPKFVPVLGVSLGDQFGTMTVDVKKPRFLCNPVDKNGEDATAPSHVGHLLCYQAKQVDAVKFGKLVGVFVNDQFGPETLDVKKPALLCVPATE